METMDMHRVTTPVEDLLRTKTFDLRPAVTVQNRPLWLTWLLEDIPYILMLLLALVGVTFRLTVGYWIMLAPVFGVICVIAGWHHVENQENHFRLIAAQALNWTGLVVAVYVLNNSGVVGEMNANAIALAMMTLLALSTFVAGVQAWVWRICAIGIALLIAVPVIGWADQSAMILGFAALVLIAIGAVVWWLEHRQPKSPLSL
jgi:hypothetical protein